MSKIILVDPQDKAERFWWIGIVVDKADYKLFYSEMGGDFADLDENLTNNVQKRNTLEHENAIEHGNATHGNTIHGLIHDMQGMNDIAQSRDTTAQPRDITAQSRDTIAQPRDITAVGTANNESMLVCYFEDGSFSKVNKNEVMELKMDEPPFTEWIKDKSFKNSRAVKNLFKFLDDKIPAKFKWLKKKRKMNNDGVFKKKLLQRKADQSFGEQKSNENGN